MGNTAFRVGQWRVDPALNEISRDGTTLKLEPRTMRVLVCLAERAGEVVSVSQLLDTVWKDLVVTQYSVYQAVAALRRTLGDDPKAPSYIASVPRRGYRLVAPIDAEAEAQDPLQPPAEPQAEAQLPEEQAPAKDELQPVPSDTSDGGEIAERRIGLRLGSIAVALLVLGSSVWWFFLRPGRENPAAAPAEYAPSTTGPNDTTHAAFAPPSHSVAVLPFTNLSGDPKQEYFSDGITEELITALSQVDALKVIARTSSFSFKGKDSDIGTIARKLNVAAILEGSVRRSGNKVRITAQLINAVNGFHLWSRDYDRDLNDVLALQTDIATAVAHELQAKLLGNEASRIELGGTRTPAAFDAYLRGAKAYSTRVDAKDCQTAIAAYTEAIRIDPNYALAFAGRSSAQTAYAEEYASGGAMREAFDRAQADARQALALAPELAEGHVALGDALLTGSFEFAQASKAYERAVRLAPGNAQALRESGRYAVFIGRVDAGLAAIHRAVVLDPLNPRSHSLLGQALYFDRRYKEAVAAFGQVITLDPDDGFDLGFRGLAYYGLGDLNSARSSCESKPDHWVAQWCMAVTYEKLGLHADAEAVVVKMKATNGDLAAYQYAGIYAQWGDTAKSLEWLDQAMQLRDPGLVYLKTDPLLDPLRKESRYRAIERELTFPN
jgi:TolB-like protein/DNA-binding winged helix-turn-helix (wHTH) protein/Tfp pilus assembly protein PilF